MLAGPRSFICMRDTIEISSRGETRPKHIDDDIYGYYFLFCIFAVTHYQRVEQLNIPYLFLKIRLGCSSRSCGIEKRDMIIL